MNFSSAEPCFLHPCYHSQDFKEIGFSDFGKLNTVSLEFQDKMRQFLARKIGTDIPQQNFVYSLSTFRIFRALLNSLPRVHNSPTTEGDDDTTVLLSPQGAYFLFNRIAGGVLEQDDCIQTVWTNKDERYKLCAEDIQRWVNENIEKFKGRPLLLLLENPSICGHLYTAEELQKIAHVCKNHNIYIFTDEVYRETYHSEETFVSLASQTQDLGNIISVFALSKSYGNLQYSLSFARVPENLQKFILGYVGDDWRSTTLHHNLMIETIFNEKDISYLEDARRVYKHKAELVTKYIQDLNKNLERPLKIIHQPQAGFATVIDFTEAVMGVVEFPVDPQFAHHIRLFKALAEKGLLLQSLHASGIRNRLCFRMVYGKNSEEEIKRAFDIIKETIAEQKI